MKYKTSGGLMSAIVTKKDTGKEYYSAHFKPNLLTNNGRDSFHQACYTNVATLTRGFGYIALTTSTASPAAGDTALGGTELAANGFSRVDASTKTHTTGTNSTIIETTFTASGTVNLIHASGTFNNASSTVLGHEAAFGTDASLISGDTLKVTWTLNLG